MLRQVGGKPANPDLALAVLLPPPTKEQLMNTEQIFGGTTQDDRSSRFPALIKIAALMGLLCGDVALAQDIPGLTGAYLGRARPCSGSAEQMQRACRFEADGAHLTSSAACANESQSEDRGECHAEALDARDEDSMLCGMQYAARLDLCRILGEDFYDPDFDEELFESEFDPLLTQNRWFPLQIGNIRKFEGSETIEIEVLAQTKLIDDVTCITVRDRVFEDDVLVEDTDDWFAQAYNGDVWYCGEEVKDYEVFQGDDPALPQLVSIDGSFKAGEDGAKAGIAFPGNPMPGAVYRQEFSVGNAEDVAEVLSTTYRYGDNAELDRFVPGELARLLCDGDCVVTHEYTPLSPGSNERKYYAPGIGDFFDVDLNTGESAQLTECNFDPRCEELPEVDEG
jgi:hypothetical protein